ncbi:15193_t:CDS:2, partial [Racocetra persica]
LTSGVSPFDQFNQLSILFLILNNKREKTITRTPQAYADLYKKCWSTELDERPALVDILRNLNQLSEENCVEFITNVINVDAHSSENARSFSKQNIANLANLYWKFIT